MNRPAVFLDRDGVLVEEIFYAETGEREAPLRPEDVRLLPGAAEAAAALRALGFALVVVSNQGGAAKGKTTLRALHLAHERFVALFAEQGAVLDDCFYSYGHPAGTAPHLTGASLDRKPSPYNLLIAAARHDIDLARSWMIGDRATDIACGRAAGVRTILVAPLTGPQAASCNVVGEGPDHVVGDLGACVGIIAAAVGSA